MVGSYTALWYCSAACVMGWFAGSGPVISSQGSHSRSLHEDYKSISTGIECES